MDYSYSSTSTPDYADWIGIPANPHTDEALTGLDGVGGTVPPFDTDIDQVLAEMEPMSPTYWDQLLGTLNFYPPVPTPAFSDDVVSSVGTFSEALTATSDQTLFDSSPSDAGALFASELGMEDVPAADHPIPALSAVDYEFTFQCERQAVATPHSILFHGYGQHQQHEVGAAVADAYDPAPCVQTNADPSAFACTTLAYLPVSKQDTVFVPDVGENAVASQVLQANDPGSEEVEERPIKRRRRQDTTPRFLCPHSGCTYINARRNNVKKHIGAVHNGERPHKCTHEGCDYASAREHDVARHMQSKHTSLGSPRKEGNKPKAKSMKAKGVKN